MAYLLTTVIPKLRDLLSKLLRAILRLIAVISRFWFRILTTVIPKLRDLLSKLLGTILRLITVISRFWFRVWNFIIYRQYEDVICGAKWCWKKCWWKNRNEITDLQGFCKDCDVKMNFIQLGATEYFSCPKCRSRAMRGLIQETIIMKPDIIKKIEQKEGKKKKK